MSESDLPDPRELLSCACFNARSAARAVTVFYDRKLKPTGLRITQYAILSTVRAAGAARMQLLASALNLDPSTLTRTLQPLERDGLLRIEEGDDRRSREVVLTAAGHRKVSDAHTLWREAQAELGDKLGAERFDRLIGDLSALTSALHE